MISSAGGAYRYRLLDNKLNELIEASECYLFSFLCGYIKGRQSQEETLGEMWAHKNGAPIFYITENTVEELLNKLFFKADYIIFFLDGTPLIDRAFMKYKMLGKRGSVIRVEN